MIKDIGKNIIFGLLILILISGIFSLFSPLESQKKISFTELVKDINKGAVEKILVSGNKLSVFYKNGKKAKTTKEAESSLSESLINYGVKRERLKEIEVESKGKREISPWIVSSLGFLLPSFLIGLILWLILSHAKKGALQTFNFTKAKARLFGAKGSPREKVTFNDVGGLKGAKEEIKEIVEFLKDPKKFLKMGARIPKGVLLLGPPGTGKTLLARATASEASVPFFSISGSELIELFVGVGAARTRDLFATAKKHQPSILFIDEIDSIGKIRGGGIGGGYEEREQTLNQLLAEMDGFEKDSEVIVMGATNKPETLDPALLRPGRFDRRIILDLPDIKGREAVLKIHSRKKPLAPDVNLREIAERTPGFSGADLANLTNEAAILAARKSKEKIHQAELLESIEKVLLGPERKSHILSDREKELAAFHEAGHALIAATLKRAETVRKVSIIARGPAAGYTLKMPKEERRIKTKSEFLAELAVLLGGYAAEKLKFKEITTGAASDLKKASRLARKLVKEYGMSSLGPVAWGEKGEMAFLKKEISEKRNYSEKIAAKIDKEVTHFIKDAQNKAKKILKKRRKTLEKLAQTLIEKETVERKEFEKIVEKN